MAEILVWLYQAQLAFTADQWAAFGSILGGFGSIFAVIGAGSLLAVEVHGRRTEARKYAEERREIATEQRERENRQRDADASLARLIIAEGTGFHPSCEGLEDEYDQNISVCNESAQMIFDVIVRIPGTLARSLIHYIKPGKAASVEIRRLPASYRVQHVGCGGPSSPYELRIMIEFTDPSGRRWRRDGWDQPTQLPNELANSALYRYLPIKPDAEYHPYDATLRRLGLEIADNQPPEGLT